MAMPLEVALTIGEIVIGARAANLPLNLSLHIEDLLIRFPNCGYSRVQIAETLEEEATAAGVALH